MSLTIDNEETCQLANELAQLTGETQPEAIAAALRERLGAGADHSGTPQEDARYLRAYFQDAARGGTSD